VTHSALLE